MSSATTYTRSSIWPPIIKWCGRLCLALLALAIFVKLQGGVVKAVGLENWNALWMVSAHALTALALLLLASIQFRNHGGIKGLLGNNNCRALVIGIPAIIVVYAIVTTLDISLGFGREAFMENLLIGLSSAQIVLFLAMLLVFPPLSEELLFRHFLIRVFTGSTLTWKWVAVIVTASLFMLTHSQYKNWPSLFLLGTLGLILGIARVTTGGIVAPVLLHSFAEVAGMTSDLILKLGESG